MSGLLTDPGDRHNLGWRSKATSSAVWSWTRKTEITVPKIEETRITNAYWGVRGSKCWGCYWMEDWGVDDVMGETMTFRLDEGWRTKDDNKESKRIVQDFFKISRGYIFSKNSFFNFFYIYAYFLVFWRECEKNIDQSEGVRGGLKTLRVFCTCNYITRAVV